MLELGTSPRIFYSWHHILFDDDGGSERENLLISPFHVSISIVLSLNAGVGFSIDIFL